MCFDSLQMKPQLCLLVVQARRVTQLSMRGVTSRTHWGWGHKRTLQWTLLAFVGTPRAEITEDWMFFLEVLQPPLRHIRHVPLWCLGKTVDMVGCCWISFTTSLMQLFWERRGKRPLVSGNADRVLISRCFLWEENLVTGVSFASKMPFD